MSGIFGVVSEKDCVNDLYYGTDYNSHLGTKIGGLAVLNENGIDRKIHNIERDQFRAKFEEDLSKMHGKKGIGVISDYEDQPLTIESHLGKYSIVSVSKINNMAEIAKNAFKKNYHFVETDGGTINPTEVIAGLIDSESSFEEGIEKAQKTIDGSCTLMLLTDKGIYAARDKFGRTPLILGRREDSFAATSETCAFYNIGYKPIQELGPGEIVLLTERGVHQKRKADDKLKICSFLWVYYGNPSSSYEGINVEAARYRCGAALAKRDNVIVDAVCGIPDSGTAHAIGYANESKMPFQRPQIKYVQTWQRSFMPQKQAQREVVASMKLNPAEELIKDKKLLFCDDSVVRGTQLKKNIRMLLKEYGAQEVHIRPACPPLCFGCKFLGFSRSKKESELAAVRAIHNLEGKETLNKEDVMKYTNPDSEEHKGMVEKVRQELGATTLQYQRLDDLVQAIGLPKEKLCTFCWDGQE